MPRLAAFAPEIFGDVEPFAPRQAPATEPEFPTDFAAHYEKIEHQPSPKKPRPRRPGRRHRIFLFLSQNGRCWFCGCGLIVHSSTVDHLQPLSRGGDNGWGNLGLSCSPCNAAKSDRTVDEYRESPRVSLRDRNGLFYGETV